MKELQSLQENATGRQVIRVITKGPRYIEGLRPYPGQKIYEMVVVPDHPGDPVPGLNAETGEFDPELAIIREARLRRIAAKAGDPMVEGLGMVKAGLHKEYMIDDRNFYDAAVNAETARKKIIKKYFLPLNP